VDPLVKLQFDTRPPGTPALAALVKLTWVRPDDPRLSAPQAAEETREVEPAAAQGLEPKLIRFDPELN